MRTLQIPMFLLALVMATLSGCTETPAAELETSPANIEPIGDSGLSRITLTRQAAERIGIETAPVALGPVVHTLVTVGEVEAAPESASGVAVRVALSPSDFARIDKSQAARILPSSRDEAGAAVGRLSEEEQVAGYGDATVLYVPATSQGFAIGQPARVEVPLIGSGAQRLTVPYQAVLYDDRGAAWVYTSPEPLVFVRARVQVDHIEGQTAVLADGPRAGTNVVTVGVAELYGAEVGVGE